MALKHIKVLELAGLAPGPYCGMILKEFGAEVIKVNRIDAGNEFDTVSNGKKSIALDLKQAEGVRVFKKLCSTSDVLIEPFRKGIMEKLGVCPNVLLTENPRLIYVRLSGYGQYGHYSDMAGHDINYLAISGLLSLFGWRNKCPTPPINYSELAGGSILAVCGILMALISRYETGRGQVVDANLTESIAYSGSWLARSQALPIFNKSRGENWLDGGAHFYDIYETKDGKYMAVGAIEPQFYDTLINLLNLSYEEAPQFDDFPRCRKIFQEKFKEKTQREWCELFDQTDSCVTPVLSLEEAVQFRHNQDRKTFVRTKDNLPVPNPAPRLSETPARTFALHSAPRLGEHTFEILSQLGYTDSEIRNLIDNQIVQVAAEKSKL